MTVLRVPTAKVQRPLHPLMFADMVPGASSFGGADADTLEVTIPATLTADQERTARLRLATTDDVQAGELQVAVAAVQRLREDPAPTTADVVAAIEHLAALVLPDYLLNPT